MAQHRDLAIHVRVITLVTDLWTLTN